MTPDDLAKLLRGEWPPPTLHWPPKDKATWTPGMLLLGVIETTLRLPRAERYAKTPGETYPAIVVRRDPDGARVTYHGYRTADEDLEGMPLYPGLLFGVVYRGERNGFEDFKHYSTSYDPERRPELTVEQVKAAQAEATATRNGSGRPAPGTAAKAAALDASMPTLEQIAGVRTREDARALVRDAGPEFKAAGQWVWSSHEMNVWRRTLTEARQVVLQEASTG